MPLKFKCWFHFQEVKCYTKSSNGDASIDDLIWGLKFVLHEFVPEEKDNITYEYYHPPCMGLKNALTLYGVNVSPLEVHTVPLNTIILKFT